VLDFARREAKKNAGRQGRTRRRCRQATFNALMIGLRAAASGVVRLKRWRPDDFRERAGEEIEACRGPVSRWRRCRQSHAAQGRRCPAQSLQ
jgi:hypothetical protein